MDYSIKLISNKQEMYDDIKKSIHPEEISYFDGTGYDSFSKLVNSCVSSSSTETIIIASDRVRPTEHDVQKTLQLLDQGYSFVALYRFAFFGMKKELMRRIGMMDERYVGGGWEDDDFYVRLREANLSMYVTEEVKYFSGKTSWKHTIGRGVFSRKWNGCNMRMFEEEEYSYDLGPSIPVNFLDSSHDIITAPHTINRLKIGINN